MTDPNEKKQKDEVCDSLDCAEHTLHESVAQNHPDWVNKDGECDACVSLEHEMAADPNAVPNDLDT